MVLYRTYKNTPLEDLHEDDKFVSWALLGPTYRHFTFGEWKQYGDYKKSKLKV